MSSNRRRSSVKNKKKVKPISFSGDDEEVESIVMAEVPVITATAVPIESYASANKLDVYKAKRMNQSHAESDEEEDQSGEDVFHTTSSGGDDDAVGKFASRSPDRRKSHLSVPPQPMTSREPSFLQSTAFQPAKPWPAALKKKVVESLRLKANESAGRELLSRHCWPSGLKEALVKSVRKLPMRFFIVDDSGSMILNDGRRLVAQGTTARLIKCTRWAELTESLLFMAELSEKLQLPSEFRLLNGSDPIVVGLGDDQGESLHFLREVMQESPAGPTPLCTHITAVVHSIQAIEKELRANGQKAVVVIATDGESSDGNVAEALQPLTNLPVLVILRLCTEEQNVIEYWNNIDNQLELDIDVIDDQLGDAKQVHEVNGWLTYGEPVHRLREFGASMKELDIIDESTMSADQMRMICAYLFCDGDVSQIPHPGVDWKSFSSKLKECMSKEPKVFCPITQSLKPWVDMAKLSKCYPVESGGGSGGCIVC